MGRIGYAHLTTQECGIMVISLHIVVPTDQLRD